ncbi:MAG: PIN domain-containing protein [Opitutaceae bacterium]|nr:PIN domain-containing protein [Opitutaceae bacterium]
MKYLLDVNVVVALLIAAHEHHESAETWAGTLQRDDQVLLCPWSEIGFVRVALAAGYVPDAATARRVLAAFQAAKAEVGFIADDRRAAHLPAWVKTPGQTGDGHLASLAAAGGAKLATFDRDIPGAEKIA